MTTPVLEKPLRVGTLNVRGLSDRRKQYQLNRLFIDQELDIVAIQETKVESDERTQSMLRPFTSRYNVCVSHAVGTSGGCCLFLKDSIGITVESVVSCLTGKLVICDFTYYSTHWRVICLYAPTSAVDRKIFFEFVRGYCMCERNVILLGDFNCVCSAKDKTEVIEMLARWY